jgi:serine/threonine protein kinase
VLRGISHAHCHGVIHTDLKHDNIFFATQLSTIEIKNILALDPPRRHPPETSTDGIVQAAVSQPLVVPNPADAMKLTFMLGDFGCGKYPMPFF